MSENNFEAAKDFLGERMSDTIYRQQAIDDLGEEPEVWEDDDEYGMGQRSEWCYIKTILETLPSAHPQWIPCSERLPDEFGEYLVTKRAIGWNCEEYNSNDIAYFDNEGFHKADKVLAWMPLPKTYGGESE